MKPGHDAHRRSAVIPRVFLIALGLAVCPCGVGASVIGEDEAGRPLHVWEPGESYQGRSQFDERLDTEVHFWAAGIPLKDVFAAIREQTGVTIGFFPAGDVNERVCANLYLSPESPPTLRELMAQLSWAMDCPFARSEGEDAPRYVLLSTSVEAGAMDRLRQEQREAMDALIDDIHARLPEVAAAIVARFAELERALGMSKQEAIATYRGVDDPILLSVLDPELRPLSEVAVSLSEAQLGPLVSDGLASVRLSELSAEQRELVRAAWKAAVPRWQQMVEAHPQLGENAWDDWSWVMEFDPVVSFGAAVPGFFNVFMAGDAIPVRGTYAGPTLWFGYLWLLPDQMSDRGLYPSMEVRLRRALGEAVSADEERRLYKAYGEKTREAEMARQVEEQTQQIPSLRTDTRDALVALALPREGSHTLWQLQEAVAAETGLHIVSDCFMQPERDLSEIVASLEATGHAGLGGLLVLHAYCAQQPTRFWMVPTGEKGWEWGDAGHFLRFRSRERDLFRRAFLTAEALEALNACVDTALPDAPPDTILASPVDVRLSSEQCIWIVKQLDTPQFTWGATIIYGDPTDGRNAYRHSFREMVFDPLERVSSIYRLLGTLSESQWERVKGEGLVWGVDFSPEPTEEAMRQGFWFERKKGDVLRVEPLTTTFPERLGIGPQMMEEMAEERGVLDALMVMVYRDGEIVRENGLPLRFRVGPKSTARLVSAHAEAEEPAPPRLRD